MIQRIQSVYLLLVALLMVTLTFSAPIAKFISDGVLVHITAFGLQTIAPDGTPQMPYIAPATHMGILFVICGLVPLVTIFLYKKRTLQIRLCVIEMVLLLGAQGMVAGYLWNAWRTVKAQGLENGLALSPTDAIPLVCIILTWLAFRAITRDEILIKSLNRIR